MQLHQRTLDVPAEPLVLARLLSDRPGLALFWDATGARPSYLACDPVETVESLDPEPDLSSDLGLRADSSSEFRALGRVPRWFGIIPYEALRHPGRGSGLEDARPAPHVSAPRWARYGAVVEITERVRVVGDDLSRVDELSRLLTNRSENPDARGNPGETLWKLREPPEPPQEHVQRVKHALELISRGELYQVNLARKFVLDIGGHPLGVLERLGASARGPYGALFRFGDVDLVGLSPELLLRTLPDGSVFTAPIKGTRPRSSDPERDAALARELDASPKERAELTMVIDVERNDLGRISVPGSVQLVGEPVVRALPTVHHREALLTSRLRPGVTRTEVLEAMLPSGSVTGAPKSRAMDVIAALEAHRRGLYTGAYGVLSHDGGLELAMAIRVLVIRGGEGHYFAGGGIVADSDPAAEVLETEWKAVQLLGPEALRNGAGPQSADASVENWSEVRLEG